MWSALWTPMLLTCTPTGADAAKTIKVTPSATSVTGGSVTFTVKGNRGSAWAENNTYDVVFDVNGKEYPITGLKFDGSQNFTVNNVSEDLVVTVKSVTAVPNFAVKSVEWSDYQVKITFNLPVDKATVSPVGTDKIVLHAMSGTQAVSNIAYEGDSTVILNLDGSKDKLYSGAEIRIDTSVESTSGNNNSVDGTGGISIKLGTNSTDYTVSTYGV